MTIPLIIVVAAAENNVIGADGDMPWCLSSDLKLFKSITMGKPMLMGRKTFEAIGKPLPGRVSIVVTRDKSWQADGAVVVNDVEQAVELARELAKAQGSKEIAVVGGGEIYRMFFDRVSTLHVTRVHARPDGDTKFPEISENEWSVQHEEELPKSDGDTAATTYRIYRRISR